MSDQTPPLSHPAVDPYQRLQIVLNADGTLTRHRQIPTTPASPDPNQPTPFLSKDVALNQANSTGVRIFLPRQALDTSSSTKLPLIVYFHGGGFILYSPTSSSFHDFCGNIAIELNIIIVSVGYRLTPEHQLPAAYDDAVEALHWIKTNQDDWLRNYADFSNIYIMGTSAGGNIAYHGGLRAAAEADSLKPLRIKGLILHQPFFGGSQRTPSELRVGDSDPVLPLSVSDLMWELALPIADRDHEYCNPTVGGGSRLLENIKLLGWRIFVTGCDGDPLIDRQIQLVKLMEEKGVAVVSKFREGDYHGVEIFEPSKAKAFHVVLKNFMSSSLAA